MSAPTSQLDVIVDQFDLAELIRTGFYPSALPCSRCGARQGQHGPTAACTGFVRPELPEGYAYADQVRPGQGFRFLSANDPAVVRHLVESATDVPGTTMLLTSRTQDSAAIHWVEGSLVVVTADPAS